MSFAVARFGPYESPVFEMGQRVRITTTGQTGEIRGFYGWNPPILFYGVRLDDGGPDGPDEWRPFSELEAAS